MNHFKDCKLVFGVAGATAATTAVTTGIIDTANFEGVAFFGRIATANAGNHVKVQQGDASNLSDAADLAGTQTVTGDDADSFLVDVFRPTKRYVRATITRTASTVTGDVYAVLYGPRKVPVTHGDTIDAEYHVSPAEGTA